MAKKENGLDVIIDKLTRSIENAVTGDNFPTEIISIQTKDLKVSTKKNGWVFDWKTEFHKTERDLYKLTIVNNPHIMQGLISLEVKEDHVFIHLIENAPFNRGENKMYL